MNDATSALLISRAKHERNRITLGIAQNLMHGGYSPKRPVRIICECGSELCRELIAVPGPTYTRRAAANYFFIVPGHGVDQSLAVKKVNKFYHFAHL